MNWVIIDAEEKAGINIYFITAQRVIWVLLMLPIPWIGVHFMSILPPSFPIWLYIIYSMITRIEILLELVFAVAFCRRGWLIRLAWNNFKEWRESRRRIKKMDSLSRQIQLSYPSDHNWADIVNYARMESEPNTPYRSRYVYRQIISLTQFFKGSCEAKCPACKEQFSTTDILILCLNTWEYYHRKCYLFSNYYEYLEGVANKVNTINNCPEIKMMIERGQIGDISKIMICKALMNCQGSMRVKYLNATHEKLLAELIFETQHVINLTEQLIQQQNPFVVEIQNIPQQIAQQNILIPAHAPGPIQPDNNQNPMLEPLLANN